MNLTPSLNYHMSSIPMVLFPFCISVLFTLEYRINGGGGVRIIGGGGWKWFDISI